MSTNIDYIRSTKAIREKTMMIYDLTKDGKTNFNLHEEKLEEIGNFVLEVIKKNYPDLKIPFHSRWGHFRVGGINRVTDLEAKLGKVDPLEMARTKLDLAITSVLLDAGAGPTWKYDENGTDFNRSEGLGVASFHMFMAGAFSTDGTLKAEASKLTTISGSDIEKHFQVSGSNPLVGIEGRASLLKALGETISKKADIFKDGRPGNIVDHLIEKHGKAFKAQDLLKAVLEHFGDIWPSRIEMDGTNLGDVWSHPGLGERNSFESLVPFHKLSQWLTYSLIEPIVDAGVKVTDVSEMTGLAEYRNGGLLIDRGLISLKDPAMYEVAHKPDSEIIIEWRALTVVFLDKIAEIVRDRLDYSPEEFPLAKVLEGGTWWAGRIAAKEKREDSSPPLKLDSDGTVF
ncbi:URC4/urg3 family protein [Bacteriovorax sp. Seq25_V]|uniref:URC4/urg3 family protein n=1 Tax=Bacteriovorax sp. Seq25_V TaxID=1201288 RepID=UPI00038A485E|nr:URC4/urg3 family protein [Bacteriovorax sp. Seq25_V]EQC43764.1 PF07958 family protein [Bacteriovorax sp. Seq25_V]